MTVQSNPVAVMMIDLSYDATISNWNNKNTLDKVRKTAFDLVTGHHGVVMESFGDTLVTAFAQSNKAMEAAMGLGRDIAMQQASTAGQLQISIGIDQGPLTVNAGRVSGTALANARTLMEDAAHGSILISDVVHQEMAADENLFISAHTTPSGLSGHQVIVTSQIAEATTETPKQVQPSTGEFTLASITLRFGKKSQQVPAKAITFTIGRAYDNDLTIFDAYISRLHARIERQLDKVVLVNLSGNGCCVKPQGGSTQVCRESHDLEGEGVIGLGLTLAAAGKNVIHYRIGSLADQYVR